MIALHRVGDVTDQRQYLLGDGRFRLAIAQIQIAADHIQHIGDHRFGRRQQARPLLRVGTDQAVRVLPFREGDDADIGFQPPFRLHQPPRIKADFIVAVERLAGDLQAA